MQKKDLLRVYQALNKMGNLTGVKFAYGVNKNINLIKPEIESLEKAKEFSAEFKKYDEARIKLAEEHAEKDEAGKPKKRQSESNPLMQEYVLDEKAQKAFDKALKKLQEEHQTAIDATNKQMEDYAKLLDEEVSIAFFPYKVKLEDVPATINVQQMHGISELIDDAK